MTAVIDFQAQPPDTDKKQLEHAQKNQITNTENNTSTCKTTHIICAIIGLILTIVIAIVLAVVLNKLNKLKYEEEPLDIKLNENNYISTIAADDLVIPSDKKLQVVGADFPHKKNTFIVGNKKSFVIDNDGKITKVSKDNFPLSISFNGTITNGSYLFKGVTCFKKVDLSKMDSSEMIDASNMFENSNFEEISFGENSRILEENYNETDVNSEKMERKGYFDTTNIRNASYMFLNCKKLK